MRTSMMHSIPSFPVRICMLLLAAAIGLSGCVSVPVEEQQKRQADLLVFPPPPEEPRYYYERTLMSSADVVEEDKDASFRRLVTGEQRKGEGMAKPYGVAAYQGRIYVADTVRRVVLMFNIPGKRFDVIGDEEPGMLGMPLGLDVDREGTLYVVDGASKRVMVYGPDGKYQRSIGAGMLEARPSGIAADKTGKRIYVVETGTVDGDGHRVRVFDTVTGNHLQDIGKRGSGPGELNLPRDVALSPDGLIYVVDGGNFRVQIFDQSGRYLKSFGTVGRRGGQFSRPKELAFDADGRVYVVDAAFGNFQVFDKDAQLLLDVGGRGEKNAPAKFMLPAGIAVDLDGRIYMVDQFFRKVDVFRPAWVAPDAGYVAGGQARSK